GEDREVWHTPALSRAYAALPPALRKHWIWWTMSFPRRRNTRFADLLELDPSDVEWRSDAETKQLIEMMSPLHRRKLQKMQELKREVVGTMYRRTRANEEGEPVQRVEIRFDDVAGCLRTPAGGSSRQSIIVVKGSRVRSRLVSARETARLMGLPDSYVLPERYNEAYHLTGDGVVVPVIKHLSEETLLPLVEKKSARKRARAA